VCVCTSCFTNTLPININLWCYLVLQHYYRHVQYYTDKSPRHCQRDLWFCTVHGHTASNVVVQISTLSKKYSGHVRNCGTNVLDQEECQEASFRPPKKSIECQRCSTNSWRQLTDCGCCCQQPMLEIGVQNFITYSGALGGDLQNILRFVITLS